MTADLVRTITHDRLAAWAGRLVAAHATPALLLGIGHDHALGEVHVCVPEDSSTALIRTLLVRALDALDRGARP